jgi:hypothetical protein
MEHEHDPTRRPKRFRDPVVAAYEVFQEVIGEKPCTSPYRKTTESHPPEKPFELSAPAKF